MDLLCTEIVPFEYIFVFGPQVAPTCMDEYVFVRRPGTGRRKQKNPIPSPVDASVPSRHCIIYEPESEREPAPICKKKVKSELAGPCCHCNVSYSPQWRKGPKGKPVLCNACGIRYLRTNSFSKPTKRGSPTITAVKTVTLRPLEEPAPSQALTWGCKKRRWSGTEDPHQSPRVLDKQRMADSDSSYQSSLMAARLPMDDMTLKQGYEVMGPIHIQRSRSKGPSRLVRSGS